MNLFYPKPVLITTGFTLGHVNKMKHYLAFDGLKEVDTTTQLSKLIIDSISKILF